MGTLAGSGFSRVGDSFQAGSEAGRLAMEALVGVTPGIVFVFTTDRYDQHELVRGVRSQSGDTPLLGCCTGGVISGEGPSNDGVAVLALGGGVGATLACYQGIRDGAARAGGQAAERLVQAIRGVEGAHCATVMLADGLTGALTDVVGSAASLLEPHAPLIGGGAGDNLKFLRTSQIVGAETLDDAVALAHVVSERPIGIGVRHGWAPTGRALVVTRSEGNVVYEFDGRPAFDAYRELFPQFGLTYENFGNFVMSRPLGLPQPGGEFLIRDPLRARPDGAIECVARVPQGALVQIMRGDPCDLFAAAREAARTALSQLGGRRPAGVLVFDCVSRLLMLGDAAENEVRLIREMVGRDTPIAGMFSFGEIAAGQIGGTVVHNKTVVVCAFA